MLYDTHAHLNDEAIFPDIEAILDRAKAAGVELINTIGYDWTSSLLAVHIAEKYPEMVYAAIGVHPHDADTLTDRMMNDLFDLAQAPKVIAWGEIGLDYHYDNSPRDIQKKAFIEQIALAKQTKLPIIIHNRESNQDMMDILKAERAGENGGILHCFSGSWEMAKFCMDLGFMISFAGPLTYKNAKTALEVAAKVPLDLVLVETDCPYLAPHPLRGKTNEPANIVHTAAKLAEIHHLDYQEICDITTQNAKRIFNISH